MGNPISDFGNIAKGSARSPLGIIALFIVLVYGFAALVTTFNSTFTPPERMPLIYFLVIFPVLVLGVFAWLVSRHANSLFGPSDFKNEDNFVKMKMSAVASLVAASAKDQDKPLSMEVKNIVQLVQENSPEKRVSPKINHLLWVDDRPDNNINERRAFEAMGVKITLATSTKEALDKLSRQNFSVIISDMGRKEGPKEGYVLLDSLRSQGNETPLFFYAASNSPEHKRETLAHRGQGCTNNAQELFQMVMLSLLGDK
ncbi:Response regulator receiver domain-containing protein [Burkholderia sp. D7]|nr:Response regulator receiver domain-containing protein [Burkholderia sp. D7]